MPTRRRLLAAAGSGLAAGLAGCVTDPTEQGSILGGAGEEPFDPLAETDLDEFAATQFRHGLHNRGYVDATVPDAVRVDWATPVNRGDHTAAKSTPVAVGEDVLIAGDTGTIRRLTPTGEERWRASVEPTTRGIHGTPAVANGTAYVGAYDGALYAFDVATGKRQWRTGIGDAIGASPTYYNGVLYVAVEYADPSGSVAAVDAASGEVRWIDQRPTDHPHSTVGIDREAGRLVFGANDGVCRAWTFPGLERSWTFETGGAIKMPVAVVDGLAVFGSWDEHVYALDLDDGTEAWSFSADGDVMCAPAITPDGTVVTGSHDHSVYALDLSDGTERWRFETGGFVIGSVTATREHVLVGSYDDRLYALDVDTGRKAWHATARGHATSAALVRNDAVYYAERADDERAGQLYRLVAA